MQYVMLSSRTMCFRSRYISLLLLFPIAAFAVVVSDVRFKLSAADLSDAAALAEDCYRANGIDTEYAAAVSWLARGALPLGPTDAAVRYLAETKTLLAELRRTKSVDDDNLVQAALGASVEVEARIMAERGSAPMPVLIDRQASSA
jgi:hypothetical protein